MKLDKFAVQKVSEQHLLHCFNNYWEYSFVASCSIMFFHILLLMEALILFMVFAKIWVHWGIWISTILLKIYRKQSFYPLWGRSKVWLYPILLEPHFVGIHWVCCCTFDTSSRHNQGMCKAFCSFDYSYEIMHLDMRLRVIRWKWN